MVVPRTMLSSTSTMRRPLMTEPTGLSLMRTPLVRCSWSGMMNVRWMYRFFMRPSAMGIPLALANPLACARPESGTGTTTSASTGDSSASFSPSCTRTS